MGLFDWVFVECLACGQTNRMQSKGADAPHLQAYTLDSVPPDVASDLGTEFTCSHCCTVHAVDIDIMRRRGEEQTVCVNVRLAIDALATLPSPPVSIDTTPGPISAGRAGSAQARGIVDAAANAETANGGG